MRSWSRLMRVPKLSRRKLLRAARSMERALKDVLPDMEEVGALYQTTADWMASQQPRAVQIYDGQFIEGSFVHAEGARRYKFYVPKSYNGEALPLVVMLHGCTQNADDFALGTGMNDVAETVPCFVLYPEQDVHENGRKCWNWHKPAHQRRDEGEPAIIAGMTEEIARHYAVDRSRLYVAGLSAGGAMAAIMGATYPDLYAAVGIHSGLPYRAARNLATAIKAMQGVAKLSKRAPRLHAVPTIVFHGSKDGVVHPDNSDRIVEKLAAELSRSKNEPKIVTEKNKEFSKTLYCDADGQCIMEDWRVHAGDHAWSGGNPAGSYASAEGPSASREMLRFFLSHKLDVQV